MELSLRKLSYYKPSKNHYHLSPSNDLTHFNDEDDDKCPILLHDHNLLHNYDLYNDHLISDPMIPTTSQGEVIVNIDDSNNNNNNNNNNRSMNNNTISSRDANSSISWKGSSDEFSFSRPNNETLEAQGQETTLDIGMDTDMDMDVQQQQQQQQQQDDHGRISRHVGLRPPLPRDSCWSRNPSEIQSPDFASGSQYKNTQTTNNNEGSKELRVSFHDSLRSELVRRPSSMYSNINDDSSSCSSSISGDDEPTYDGNHHKDNYNISREMSKTNNASSFQRMTSTLSKTKSRLIDPPSTPLEQRSGVIHKSGQLNMRSGILGKGSSMGDDDEDDPFLEDDFPDEFSKSPKISTLMIIEWVSLISIMGALICSLVIPVLRRKTLWKLKLWKWEVLILSLICGRLVSSWGIRLLVFFIEMNLLLRKRVLYFVYGLKNAVQNVIWFGLVLITWYFMFDNELVRERSGSSQPIEVVTKMLIIGEVGAILWLLKTLLVKVLASNYHVKAFFDRIQESLFNQFVIETLSAPPVFESFHQEEDNNVALSSMIRRTNTTTPFNNGKSSIGGMTYRSGIGLSSTKISEAAASSKKYGEGITIDHLHKLNQKNVSAWNMKRLMRIIRNKGLTTLDEQLVDALSHDDEYQTQIRSEVQAKAAARKIFRNVAKPHSRYIYIDDIMRFMRADEAMKTMNLFEGAIENDRISRKSLKNWVVYAFRERRALALTLSDTKSAVNKLHKMVNVIVSIIIIIIALNTLDFITSQSIVFLSSQVVLVAFVFGNMCKNVFECIIFLFVIHPYDVGDRCEIDTVQMVVEEINILTTVFLRYDNQKIVYPNYVLLTKPIHNFYRSPDMGDAIELVFHIATPAEKIAIIRQRITSYIENKKEHWHPSPMIVLKEVERMQMLRIAVWLTHRMNHQDMGERWVRRALLIEECINILREMDMEYRIYPLNVNVTSLPPLNQAQMPSSNWNAPYFEGGKDIAHP